ncbi:hypothetical protein Syun_031173 [Stephania yunnanensis]|uniref:Uncharacterized protein n=1 Tax=Stephania yunnanensis TaxID=152371 RepID=A0AAP0DWT7_9MAGN
MLYLSHSLFARASTSLSPYPSSPLLSERVPTTIIKPQRQQRLPHFPLLLCNSCRDNEDFGAGLLEQPAGKAVHGIGVYRGMEEADPQH